MAIALDQWKQELEQEARAILAYWMEHTLDEEQGGFIGQLSNANVPAPNAAKGVVLNSRILYTFSLASRHYNEPSYALVAKRAYNYLVAHFIDPQHGGVYWSVTAKGAPLDEKKQVYAIAFSIYGLSEYYKISHDQQALQHAIKLYGCIEAYNRDNVYGGYIEALTRDWQPMEDLRLSAKDSNEKKSMNTHLHVLEAYANLYLVWPDPVLKKNIEEIILLFLNHIIHPETNHLILFFDEKWTPKSQTVSFGHDIEAAWLVQEAAAIINDGSLLEQTIERSLKIAQAAEKGIDADGGLWYEKEGDELVLEKHWWPQAEAMVGFYNAWQNSGEQGFLQRAFKSWQFILQKIKDHDHGEWFWGVDAAGEVMEGEDKVGMWKCPYHNGRACFELLTRIKKQQAVGTAGALN